jgi:hypothetical protein
VPSAKYIILEPDLDRGRRTDSEDPELDIDHFHAKSSSDSPRTGD